MSHIPQTEVSQCLLRTSHDGNHLPIPGIFGRDCELRRRARRYREWADDYRRGWSSANTERPLSEVCGTFRRRSIQRNPRSQSRPERPRSSGTWTVDPNPLAPRRNEKSKRYCGSSHPFQNRNFWKPLHQVHRATARSKIRNTRIIFPSAPKVAVEESAEPAVSCWNAVTNEMRP